MTPQQRDAYLIDSNRCPYCNSKYISIDDRSHDGDELVQAITCKSCGKDWREIYRFVDVEGTE